MWLWTKVLNITWYDKVCNDEVLRRVGEERAIISVIHRIQRIWLGHTLRHGDLVPLIIEGRIVGKRPRGRPAGQSKEWPSLRSSQEARLRSRTIRKDLVVGRIDTHITLSSFKQLN